MSDDNNEVEMGVETSEVRRLGQAALPGPFKLIIEAGMERYVSYRRREYTRRFWEVIDALGDAQDEDSVQQRVDWIFEEPARVRELGDHLNSLIDRVVPEVERAYVALAADSLNRRSSPEFARDLGRILRELSSLEAPVFRMVVSEAMPPNGVRKRLLRGLDVAQQVAARRIVAEFIARGVANRHRQADSQLNRGKEAPWGCTLRDDGNLELLERYSGLVGSHARAAT